MEGARTCCITCRFSPASKSMCVLLLLLAGSLLSTTHAVPTSSLSLAPIAADEQALHSFRALVTGDPHGVLSSWTSGNGTSANVTGMCSWRGVGCHSRLHPGRVTSLELPSSNLTGAVSPFLANLTFLRTLNLSHNSFSGNIPWELGFLPRLWYLDLRHNSVQGMIPLSLARASKLRILQLEYNSLMGEIPANLSSLPELEVLDVGANQLSGAVPPSFGSLSKLTYLGLYLNNLAGGIPPSLEYGMDGKASIQGDVYSYGVLLLEMFTGKRPTDSLFQGGKTLQSYVSACHPDRIMEIVDPTVLPLNNGYLSILDSSCDGIDAKKLQECMASIFRVGLQCSQESSRARMHISNAIRELEVINDALVNDC
ncbi:probable LRR receptor-like serine/threonine-protein kinase At3g47570 [Phragmites australis]|uniref:probable LRR receptor-like serine/threonine-protein kinase At3g47570 n=1 Tax=Phragmites australis TaxID=29695 RepID=UPI002D7655A0|nr:probable LRR receptor-like serine/threonine-protein kinase At3g47570 [Phragmites australis]